MDHLTLRPASVSDAVAAYEQAAAFLQDGSRRLTTVLTPLFGSADPAVAQAVHDVAAAFRDSFDIVTEGHRHAGAALDAAVAAVVGLDQEQAGHW